MLLTPGRICSRVPAVSQKDSVGVKMTNCLQTMQQHNLETLPGQVLPLRFFGGQIII
jgi:hypothetical protein